MRIILSLCLFFFLIGVSGQDKYILAGDRLMERSAFLEALEKYQISYIYNEDYTASQRIASVYFILQRFEESANWQKKLLAFNESTPQDNFDYAKTLIQLNKIDEALEQVNLFLEKVPGDPKGKKLLYLATFLKNGDIDPIRGKNRAVDYCVELKASNNPADLGPDVKLEWLFDDGTLVIGPVAKHCFKTSGKHSVKLSSIDKTYETIVRQDTVLPIFLLEEVNFDIEGLAWIDAAVKFDARSLAYRKNILGVVWQTGDGNIIFDEVFTHKYVLKGNYSIVLTVIAQDNGNIYPGGSIVRSWNVIER